VEALRGFLFGVAIAAPVGPIALLLIRTGLTHPLRNALAAATGVAAADFTYALVALSAGSGLGLLLRSHRQVFQTASSALLLALGVWLLAGVVRRPMPSQAAAGGRLQDGPGFIQLYLLTLANPLTVLLFVGFSGQMAVGGGALAVVGNALFLFLGSLAVQASYAAFGAALQRLIRHPGAVRTLNATGAVAVAVFGAYGLWKGG
jgi:threonine/homoserine/homoserine lactone efflux protein